MRALTPAAYRRMTLPALLSLSGIVVTGAAVRLTGSGLGCSDWPVCEREQPVPEADLHAWIEFGNRLITGVVSVAVVIAVLGALRRVPRRRDLVLLAWGLVAGVVAQIVVGAFTVIWHLPPGVVMVHFLLSMVLVANATVLHLRAREEDPAAIEHLPSGTDPERRPALTGRSRTLVDALWLWSWVVVVTGTIVTAAGPHRGDPDVEPLDLDLPGVARIHAISVIVFLAGAVVLAHRLHRDDTPDRNRRPAVALVVVGFGQALIGYVQYFTDVPALLVGAHIAGATLLFVVVTWLWWSRDVVTGATSAAADPSPTASVAGP